MRMDTLADQRATVRLSGGRLYRGIVRYEHDVGFCAIEGIDDSWYPEEIEMIDHAAPEHDPFTGRRAIDGEGAVGTPEPISSSTAYGPDAWPVHLWRCACGWSGVDQSAGAAVGESCRSCGGPLGRSRAHLPTGH